MDNPLKAIIDSIAEADNEIGGQLITRLRQAHRWGGNDGEVAAADPDRLTSKTDAFESTDVGMLVDFLEADTPTGNEGTYQISTYVDSKNVDVVKIDGTGAPSFVDEDPVQWRFASLRTESTYLFPYRDVVQQLYVGNEEAVIPYADLVQTPGAQEFRGLGEHRFDRLGATLRVASPQVLISRQEFFSASDVGKAFWILPLATPNGNEGPRVISVVTNSRQVTFTGPAIVADEDAALYLVKTYSGNGYLTRSQRLLSEVIDGSGSYSALDKVRRSFLIDLAVEEEIDRIARRLGLERPRGISDDEIWRRVVMVRAYLAASTVYSLELMLDALYPQGGWSVTEDLSLESLTGRPRHANEVFIQIPDLVPGSDSDGRAYLDALDSVTSGSATSVTASDTPVTVYEVGLDPVSAALDMDVLPSADSPAWTYQAESAGTEGTYFSVVNLGKAWTPSGGLVDQKALQHVAANPGTDSGRYYRTISEIDTKKPKRLRIQCAFRIVSKTTVGGKPWQIVIDDGEYEYSLLWSDAAMALGQSDGTEVATYTSALATGTWARFRLERVDETILGYLNGVKVLEKAASSFAASSAAKQVSFGYFDNAASQNWTAQWDDVETYVESGVNYWNLFREDGSLATASDVLTSALGLFTVPDTGKRVFLDASNNVNWGLWAATYTSATQLTLAAIPHPEGARVYTTGSEHFLVVTDPLMHLRHVGKDVIVSGSSLGNDRTVEILEFLSPWMAKVSNPGADFVDEDELDWEFDSAFVNESSIPWELVDAGSLAGAVLTLREALPVAAADVSVRYTAVLSGQILRNEFVSNSGVAPTLYYPYYLLDVNEGVQELLENVTAAGVIPKFGVTPS